nr:hypothetical protein [Angustibacter aerolatus]
MMAAVYAGAVTVNSVRQGYGVPVVEPVARWLLAGLAALVVLVLLSVRPGRRRS